jgi:hypothetical protein
MPVTTVEKLVRYTREDDYEKRWIVVGKAGALDFHCSHAKNELSRRFDRIGGVEFHYRQPAHYMGEDYASHEHCWILGGKCWHDGTSLRASEHWIPLLERGGEEAVWRELEYWYGRHEWPDGESAEAPQADPVARLVETPEPITTTNETCRVGDADTGD